MESSVLKQRLVNTFMVNLQRSSLMHVSISTAPDVHSKHKGQTAKSQHKIHKIPRPSNLSSHNNTLTYKQQSQHKAAFFLKTKSSFKCRVACAPFLATGSPGKACTPRSPQQTLAATTRPPARANTNPGACTAAKYNKIFAEVN